MCRQSYSPERKAEMALRVPLGRMAEVGRVVLFLASRLYTDIAGQSLLVDGGYVFD